MPSRTLAAAEGQVHLWVCAPERVPPALLARYPALLDAGDVARVQRLARPADRRALLVARALLRSTLAAYTGRPPDSLRFERGAHGRPFLPGEAGLRFNLSHTPGLVALALTGASAVGVDAERMRERDHTAVVRRFFAPAERARLEALAPAEREREFFSYWVLKEAYAKAHGRGIALGFSTFAVRLQEGVASVQAHDGGDWWLGLFQPTPAHRLGLALPVRAGGLELRARWAVPLGAEKPLECPLLAATTSPRMI